MRLASYNVENLFARAKALNLEDPDDGTPIVQAFGRLNILLNQAVYSAADKAEIAQLLVTLGMEASDTGPFVQLRRNRGALVKRPQAGGIEVVANGRADWVGFVELRVEPVNVVAMRMTAKVIAEVDADIIGIIEAESRPSLAEFNAVLVPAMGGTAYRHVMLIDGNDVRGIDVGLMTRPGLPIGRLRSHVDDEDAAGQPIFSRDCAEYEVALPGGRTLLIMVNHLKSKLGSQAASNKKRKLQAERVKAIYEQRRTEGFDFIAVLGDFNDTPASAPLAPLLAQTDLKDVFELGNFDNGGRPGTFGGSTAANKIDYILMSPALFATATGGGIFRKGMWPGVQPPKWPKFPEITREAEAASDHGAVYVDLNI
jgi:endonuclease/exonuclease/phosphatase family metal-dependent hydrolase